MMMHDIFQKAVINECHNPGLFDFGAAKFDDDWLLSVYLPNFWDCFPSDHKTATRYLHKLAKEAQGNAKRHIEELLQQHAPRVIKSVHGDVVDPDSGTAPKASELFVDRLLQAAELQKDVNCDRQKLYISISQIPGLKEVDEVKTVMEILRRKKTEQTIIDEFGSRALTTLLAQYDRPALVSIAGSEELSEVAKSRKAELEEVVGEDAEIEDEETQPPSTMKAAAKQKSKVCT